MGMGVGGQDIFIADAVPVAGDAVAPFHVEDQVQLFRIIGIDAGVMKFMSQKPGASRKIGIGTGNRLQPCP
jgi:hypothetical protein